MLSNLSFYNNSANINIFRFGGGYHNKNTIFKLTVGIRSKLTDLFCPCQGWRSQLSDLRWSCIWLQVNPFLGLLKMSYAAISIPNLTELADFFPKNPWGYLFCSVLLKQIATLLKCTGTLQSKRSWGKPAKINGWSSWLLHLKGKNRDFTCEHWNYLILYPLINSD